MPCSTSRPASNTNTRSARLGRRQPVRDRDHGRAAGRQPSERLGDPSLGRRVDRADVASSRISSPGSPICARASATSWRSPTLSASPRSPTRVSQARPAATRPTPPSPSSSNAVSTSRSVAPSAARTARSRGPSCRTGSRPAAPCGSRARRDVGRHVAQVDAADQDPAAEPGRPGATSASRTSSCRSRSRRRSRRDRPPAPTSEIPWSTSGPSRYAYRTSSRLDRRARPRGQLDARRSARRSRPAGRAPRGSSASRRSRSASRSRPRAGR